MQSNSQYAGNEKINRKKKSTIGDFPSLRFQHFYPIIQFL